MKKFSLLLILGMAAAILLFRCGKEATRPDLRNDLKPKGSISGFVLDKHGRPVGGVIISASADSSVPGVSALNGAFTIGSVQAGTHTLSFLHRDYESDTTYRISVGEGQDVRMVDTVRLAYSYFILSGRVVNGSGNPVPGVGVSVSGTAMTALTDENGVYVIPRVDQGTTIKLLAAKTEFGFNSLSNITGVRNDTTDVPDIYLSKPGCTITGIVTDSAGNPVRGAVVKAVGGGLVDTTDASGRYELTNFPSDNPDTRIYVTYNGKTGGVTGLMAADYATLTGADIRLHSPAAMTNGMLLSSGDILVPDTASRVTLRIYPEADSATRIDAYHWYFGSSASPDTVTALPYLTLSRTTFTGHYSGITDSSYPVRVISENSDGDLSAEVRFMITLKTLVLADSSLSHSGSINSAETWYPKNNPHVVTGTLYVNAPLTLKPGVVVQFKSKADLVVGYSTGSTPSLIAEGTERDSIRFTSDNSTKLAGDWDGLSFQGNTADDNTRLSYCSIEYGANGLILNDASISITHCAVRNSKSTAITLTDGASFITFSNNRISGNKSYPLNIFPDNIRTIGTGNIFSGNDSSGIRVGFNSSSSALSLTATWLNLSVPYLIYCDITIHSTIGATLTIAPGCSLVFAATRGLATGYYSEPGNLVAKGTSDSIIVFTSMVKAPGNWDGLHFGDATQDDGTLLEYCRVENGTNGLYVENCAPSIKNTVVTKSKNTAVHLTDAAWFSAFSNNQITGNKSYPLGLYPEYIRTIGAGNMLTGNDSSGIRVGYNTTGNSVSTSATWPNLSTPYLIYCDITVHNTVGATLTIAPGCSLVFGATRGLATGYYSEPGNLVAKGTSDSVIVFTSMVKAPGNWDGLHFGDATQDDGTMLEYCRVENGTNGLYIENCAPSVKNTVVTKSKNTAVHLTDAAWFSAFSNNQITGNKSYPLGLYPEYIRTIGAGNVLTGNDSSGIRVGYSTTGNVVSTSATWPNLSTPYLIYCDITIHNTIGATLTIAPGCSLVFAATRGIITGYYSEGGSLRAIGKADSLIVWTSMQKTAGTWDGITFDDATTDASAGLDYCVVEYGGGNGRGNVYCNNSAPTLSNLTVRNSSTYGIYATKTAAPVITGVTYSGNASGEYYKVP